jgi:hypothetical protein
MPYTRSRVEKGHTRPPKKWFYRKVNDVMKAQGYSEKNARAVAGKIWRDMSVPEKMKILDQEGKLIHGNSDYDFRERAEFNRQIQEVERAPLTERKEGFAEYLDDLKNNPALVAERIGWLLNGSYGKGSYDVARQIINSPRMNQTAALGVIIAALEWRCSNALARKAYNALSSTEQAKLNSLIKEEIAYHKSNLQGGRSMKFLNLRKIPKRLKKGSSQAKRAMKKLRALRKKGKRIAKKAKIKPFYFSKERTPKRRRSVRRVRENLEPIIIKEGSMGRRKRRKSRKVSGVAGRRSRRSRRTYRGEFGRRRRSRRYSGGRGLGGFNPVKTVMEVAGIGAGAVGGSFVAKFVPIADVRIKALVPIALGVLLPMLKFGKNALMQNVATGSLAVGTIALIKALVPQVPMLAGANSAEEVIDAIDSLPEEQQALLGVTIETAGQEEVLTGQDTQVAPLSPADSV